MSVIRTGRDLVAAVTVVAALTAATLAIAPTPATAAPDATAASTGSCPDVHVVFARGTSERPGLGMMGAPLVRGLEDELADLTVTSYAVDYAANLSQTSAGPGATDMTNHVTAMAAQCPATQFVLGGYSQGATVTSIAVGIRTGTTRGESIPDELSDRVAAVVVFGNPLNIRRQTIASESPAYADKARDYCNRSDAICGRQGTASGGHLSYVSNGSVADAASFAASLVAVTPPGDGGPTPPPDGATCVTARAVEHVEADRAFRTVLRAYARGSRDDLGRLRSTDQVSLRQTGTDSWERTASC